MYDAFISYRHSELDRFVAENLHKKLEAFRLPKSLVKQRRADCKKKIERVFRDRDELPLATNLADPITQALEDSEFLIVICSPRLPQSLWCKKEIETFISMHGREHVLAVLIEGEPEESFPPELLYREREVTAEDGTTQIVREPVEPLAADVRGTTKKEILKKMDEELLRLAAAMFDCGYDDLKQRHKEQKMKKLLTVSLSASAVFLLFGAVSTAMAIRIQAQKEEIRNQAEEITAQKEKIEAQYQEALYNQSLSMAEKSRDLLAEGDRLGALEIAYEALGETEDGTPMPVTAEAQYALAESSYLYQDGNSLIPMYMFNHEANVIIMQISPNKERMLTVDQYGNITVWDVMEHNIITQFTGGYLSATLEKSCFFLNDSQIIYNGEDNFEVYDIEKQRVIFGGENSIEKGVVSEDGKWFAVAWGEKLWIYETETFTIVYYFEAAKEKSVGNAMCFEKDVPRFVFSQIPSAMLGNKGTEIIAINLEDGETIGRYPVKYSSVESMQVSDGIVFAGVNQTIEDVFPNGGFDLSVPYKSCVYAIRLDDMSLKWSFDNEEQSTSDIEINSEDFSRHIMISYHSEACILNLDTGICEHEFEFGDEIIASFFYIESDRFIAITREGEYHILRGTDGLDIVFTDFFQTNSDNLKYMKIAGDGFVTLPYSCNAVTYFSASRNDEYTELAEMAGTIIGVEVNHAENRAVTLNYLLEESDNEIYLLDLNTGEIIQKILAGDYNAAAGIVEDGSQYFYVFADDVLKLYSIMDGSLYTEYQMPESISVDSFETSDDGKYLIIKDFRDFWIINFFDGSTECFEYPAQKVDNYVMSISKDFSSIAFADKEEKAILFYHQEEEEPFSRIDVVASFVQQILYTEDNRYLLVGYYDGRAEMYEIASGECVQKYDYLSKDLQYITTIGKNEGYLVFAFGEGYLLDSEFGKLAQITGCKAIMPNSGKLLCTDNDKIYTLPIYTMEQMREKAEKILTEFHVFE